MVQQCNKAFAIKNTVNLTHVIPIYYSLLAIIYSL